MYACPPLANHRSYLLGTGECNMRKQELDGADNLVCSMGTDYSGELLDRSYIILSFCLVHLQNTASLYPEGFGTFILLASVTVSISQ